MSSIYQKGDLQKSNTAKKRFTIRFKQEKKIAKNVSETLEKQTRGGGELGRMRGCFAFL